jgi:hypothetical protein
VADRSELTIAVAKTFLHFVQEVASASKRAFFRYDFSKARRGSTASIDMGYEVNLVDPFKHRAFFDEMNALFERLTTTLGKTKGVFLLQVDDSFNCNIQFEHGDMDRWRISKLDGSGVPEGLT